MWATCQTAGPILTWQHGTRSEEDITHIMPTQASLGSSTAAGDRFVRTYCLFLHRASTSRVSFKTASSSMCGTSAVRRQFDPIGATTLRTPTHWLGTQDGICVASFRHGYHACQVYVIDSSDRRRLEESSAELRELLAEDKLAAIPMLPGTDPIEMHINAA